MIDASHDYILEKDVNNLSWKFNGIDLPPSVENTNIGKGYIVFQIKPTAGYALGDIIPNTAYIYFDFNPAIITNTQTTEFVAPLSNPSFAKNLFLVYPNPMTNEVFVTSKNNTSIESLNITDVLGKTIYSEKINSTKTQLDVSGFQKGIYFLRVKSNGSEEVVKMIKQ
ncbi:MAG: T9SS type A sorting domain-containing protein [Flavobacterium sp.]|nr:T9SS type A sorting domain-containing protein [Flavobacterium sp.]